MRLTIECVGKEQALADLDEITAAANSAEEALLRLRHLREAEDALAAARADLSRVTARADLPAGLKIRIDGDVATIASALESKTIRLR
jgi:hypothetical protein